MLNLIAWYLMTLLVGWLAFPILFRLFPELPDRGLSVSKIMGLLIWGYSFWILGRLDFTRNDAAGLIFCLLLVAALSIWSLWKGSAVEIRGWLHKHRRILWVSEVLFLTAFLGWALIRAYNPDILGTEKPMELAFINAIMRSDTFPPHDPWLSGYGISYYYLGYILVGMLAKITGTLGSEAFNLGVALIFGLTAAGSYGLLLNLLSLNQRETSKNRFAALLGPLFTLIVSNWEGALHYLHSRGFLWLTDADGKVAGFWRWMDIQDLTSSPDGGSFGHWWWWRASRVIKDYDFSGFGYPHGKEVISEFPFFSYLLADLHPHVLSMPFVFLVLSAGLVLFLKPDQHRTGFLNLGITSGLFLLAAWLTGSMAFLNTWNFPMYVGVLAGAYALRRRRLRPGSTFWQSFKDLAGFGILLGLTGGVLYLPFYLGFDSQAGGVIPNLLYVTRGNQFWVMFGPLLIPILGYLGYQAWKNREHWNWRFGLTASLAFAGGLLIFMLLMVVLLGFLPLQLGDFQLGRPGLLQTFLGSLAAVNLWDAVRMGLTRRLVSPGTLVTLLVISFLCLSLLFQNHTRKESAQPKNTSLGDTFLIILIFSGLVLVLVPEFVYLRDLFGYRINTIFKFYFQAWLMWSTAAAYSVVTAFRKSGGVLQWVWQVGLLIAVGLGLVYPVLSLPSKTGNFSAEDGLSLDGAKFFNEYYPDDAQAAAWLKEQEMGVIAEAVGGSYSFEHARMATYTGFPTVLGWDFHEVQWRGGSELVNPRKEDMEILYCTHNWQTAQAVLDRYHVRYLVLGNVEKNTYLSGTENCPNGLTPEKFSVNLEPVYQRGSITIYEYQPPAKPGDPGP